MIEAFGDPDYTDETYLYSARWAINQVRANVGMPDITVTGKTDFIAALRNEWRVEFAFEDHRFWDVRRWKIGDATQRRIHGVEITRTGSEYTFRRKVCDSLRTPKIRMSLIRHCPRTLLSMSVPILHGELRLIAARVSPSVRGVRFRLR